MKPGEFHHIDCSFLASWKTFRRSVARSYAYRASATRFQLLSYLPLFLTCLCFCCVPFLLKYICAVCEGGILVSPPLIVVWVGFYGLSEQVSLG